MFKHLYFLFLCSSFFYTALSQNQPLPKAHPIAIAAPHLPLLRKYTGQGIIFNVDNNKYSFEGNEHRFKEWMDDYPDELLTYKNAIAYFLKHISPEKLSGDNKQLYIDLKAQSLLIAQF